MLTNKIVTFDHRQTIHRSFIAALGAMSLVVVKVTCTLLQFGSRKIWSAFSAHVQVSVFVEQLDEQKCKALQLPLIDKQTVNEVTCDK